MNNKPKLLALILAFILVCLAWGSVFPIPSLAKGTPEDNRSVKGFCSLPGEKGFPPANYAHALKGQKGEKGRLPFSPFHAAHWSKHPVTWSPEKIEETIGKGTMRDIPVSFITRAGLKNATLWVTPELKRFIRLDPVHFEKVEANTSYQLTLHLVIPERAKGGSYEGAIHLRVDKKTYPSTLKVKLQIAETNTPPCCRRGT